MGKWTLKRIFSSSLCPGVYRNVSIIYIFLKVEQVHRPHIIIFKYLRDSIIAISEASHAIRKVQAMPTPSTDQDTVLAPALTL